MQLPRSRRLRRDLAAAAVVALVVFVEVGLTFHVFTELHWDDPITYVGDAQFTPAVVTAARRGDFVPFMSKELPSLGAPFVASWNDFPLSEDVLMFLTGQAARVVGVFTAINVGYILGAMLAGVSLFAVARRFHLARPGAVMGGILYGLAMYGFARNVHHWAMTFFWIVPWQALAATWLASRKGIVLGSRRFWWAAAIGVITAWSNIYYLFFAMQLFGLAFLFKLVRSGKKTPFRAAGGLLAITLSAALLMHLDTLMWVAKNGSNPGAVVRAPTDLELFALKPVNFILPASNHRFEFMRGLVGRGAEQSIIRAEQPSPYLGFVGVFILVGLAVHALRSLALRRMDLGVAWAAMVAYLTIAHSVGGLNSYMGLAGIRLIRSTNRASIIIFAYVLLFGAWMFPRLLRRVPTRGRWAIALVLGVFGAWEAIPMVPASAITDARTVASSDRKLVTEAERVLPVGASVFQLPPMDFPEGYAPGIDTYEMFRPYYFANHLKFSHGDVKGRPNASWKFRVGALPPAQMLAELKAKGFSGLYINFKGYSRGNVPAFEQAGARVISTAEIGDSAFLAF